MARRHHGMRENRGMNEAAMTPQGPVRSRRFYNLYANLDPYPASESFLRRLGAYDGGDGPLVGERGEGDDADVPAVIAFLGQFVDHEITFDPTSEFGRRADPAATRNFRTPRLELDALYRAGSEATPFLYDADDEAKLLVGDSVYDLVADGDDRAAGLSLDPDDESVPRARRTGAFDLQRNAKGTAVIGDPRNDENAILSQLTLAFVRFHNRVVDYIRSGEGADEDDHEIEDGEAFETAARLVRRHYHWILLHEFLPSILDGSVLDAIRQEGRRTYLPDVDAEDVERGDATAAIPIEFAVAAYRYGHSQIRDRYAVNDDSGEVPFFPSPDPPAVPEGLLPDDVGLEAIEERLKAEGVDAAPDHVDATSAAGGERSLAGFGRLPPDLVVDWSYLAADAPVGEASFDGPLQPGRAIDAELPPSLFDLPFVVEGVESLAARNLLRGRTFGLPSGQAVAEALGRAPLSNADLPIDEGRSYADYLRERRRGADVEAPLWLYVIAEADAHNDGDRLGAVGSRLVGEVLHGLIHADTESYVNAEPDWTPTLPTRESTPDGEFRLADLLAFAAGPARDGLAVADVYPDGTGAPPLVVDGDDPTNGEAIELVHEGRATLSMRGYTAFYGDAGQQFEIPSLTLEPGETALVYTGAGDPDTDGTAVCLGLDRPVINDDGDRVVVRTSAGGVCDHVVT